MGRDGLYRGDAPVSLPGMGGAPPRAYRHADSAYQADVDARRGYEPAGSTPGVGSRRSGGVFLALLLVVGIGVGIGWYANTRDEGVSAPSEVSADLAPPGDLPEGAAADLPAGAAQDGGAYDAAPADRPGESADRPGASDDRPGESADRPGASDDRLLLGYEGAQLGFTVYIGELHPHGLWRYAMAGASSTLAVTITIDRLDGGADPVELTAFNWLAETAADGRVSPSVVETVDPTLTRVSLTGGSSVTGTLTFPITDPQVTLRFTSGILGEDIAYWDFTALAPGVVSAALGDAVAGAISMPPFTVAVTEVTSVPGDDPDYLWPADSGRYLRARVAVAADAAITDAAGLLGSDNFVFIADEELPAVQGVTDDAFTIQRILPGLKYDASLSFDTAATSGVLELRDQAGDTIIRWPLGDAG